MKKALICTFVAACALLLGSVPVGAANKKTSVDQVTSTITLTDDVDYIVTSGTPFGNDGVVNIANTDHAVLILAGVRPSAALSLLAKHVQIDGARAINNSNCQVKIYNLGCIILPYGNAVKPLTVYSEQDFGGDSCNDFGLENSGGYMNTLTADKLNNRIRSFKLKRGYMVTFSNKAGGRGYSRCFIAADADLEFAKMPAVLDRSISSYRVFKWYDVGKKNLANCMDKTTLDALHVQSSYDWGQGNSSFLPDYEWVPNHIYEDWPSSSTIGSTTQSPHSKTNNEPFNSSDDHPQDLKTILNNWENMMRTGLRLCSPASHDGALTQHHAFLDSIDARGWRCDIIDLHCYWNEWNFSNSIKGAWVDRHHRPVWISEWIWGSSWGNNGIFGVATTSDERDNPSANTLQTNKEIVSNICNALNGFDYIERYYYWNSEANCSKLYYDGKLTPAGEMYANLDGGVGYNGRYDYAPTVPEQYDPSDLVLVYDRSAQAVKLTWKDYNGDFNSGIYVERRQSENHSWATIADIPASEEADNYEYLDEEGMMGNQYRIRIVDGTGKDRYTKTVTAASADFGTGDAVMVNDKKKYLGGNIFFNGDFDMGTYGWVNGEGNPLPAEYFQVIEAGSIDGGSYLQTYGNGGIAEASAIKTSFDVESGADYYFSGVSCNTPKTMQQIQLSNDGTTLKTLSGFLYNSTSNWLSQFSIFNTGEYSKIIVAFRSMGGTISGKYLQTQVDKLKCFRLYDTPEEAYADGSVKLRLAVDAFIAYNTLYTSINDNLKKDISAVTTSDKEGFFALQTALDNAKYAYATLCEVADKKTYWEKLIALGMPGCQELLEMLTEIEKGTPINGIVELKQNFDKALEEYMPLTFLTDKISQPNFNSTQGWTIKAGTFKGGDQRINKKDDVTFWNAWWSDISASEGINTTMEINQKVDGLSHGLYMLQCKASTEHYCLSDQHGYITDGTITENTQNLKADYFDLPSMPAEYAWETLSSAPIYLADDASVTIGFVGSKEGATDNAWKEIGNETKSDKREGWWAATGFQLGFHPLYRTTVVPDQWNVICLPYNVKPSADMKFYEIAGITEDLQYLGLSEIQEGKAGVPFIFKSTKADVSFFEYGNAVTRTTDAPGNLRGFFKVNAKAPKNTYFLVDGVWTRVGDDRPQMSNYTGIIRSFTDTSGRHVKKLVDWTGEKMPIVGVTAEDYAADISPVHVATFTEDGIYTLDGRPVDRMQLRNGIYIKVENGRIIKMINK